MKTTESKFATIRHLDLVTAGLIGLTPVMIFLGRAPLAVTATLALILVFVAADRRAAVQSTLTILRSRLSFALAVLFMLWLPNIAVSPDPDHSIFTVLRSAIFLIAAVLLWAFLSLDMRRVDFAIRTMSISACILAAIAVTAILWWPQLYNITHLKPLEPVNAVLAYKQTGSAAVLMLPLVVLCAWRSSGKWRIFALLACILLVAVTILTGSRAGWIGIIAGGLCVGVAAVVRGRLKRTGIVFIALCSVVLTGAVAWNFDTRRASAPEDAIVYMPIWTVDWHRQTIWATAWEKSADHRLFGVGANAINSLPGAHDVIGTTNSRVLAFHPHNWVVEVATETGIISLTVMLAILTFISWRLWSDTNSGNASINLVLIWIWVGYWVSGLFNFSYWSSWWMLSFYICFGIALAGARAAGKQFSGDTRRVS